MGSWIFEGFPVLSEFKLFCSACSRTAQASVSEKNVALSFLLSKKTFSAKSQCDLCKRIVLVATSSMSELTSLLLSGRRVHRVLALTKSSTIVNVYLCFLVCVHFSFRRRHCLNFYRRIKRSSVLIVECVNISRQFPCCLVGTIFLL